MKMSKKFVFPAMVAISCLLFLLGCTYASGQEASASLGGKVVDSKGAALQKANVSVRSEATGVIRSTLTNDEGAWRVQGLPVGHYGFEVIVDGFKTAHYSGIDLQAGDQKIIDTSLSVGSQVETVEVKDVTPLIDTTAAVSGTVLTDDMMEELPTQSNAPTMFVELVPGSTVSNGLAGSGVFLWSNSGLTNVAVNGTGSASSNTSAINYTIDGGTDTNNLNQVAFMPPVDAIKEIRVVTDAFDASIGRNLGTTMMMVTKTGGAKYHGDLYESNQNDFLNANTYQNKQNASPITPVRINYYGGTVSGPVWISKLYDGKKKKTFFFLSYSGIHSTSPTNTGYLDVPTDLERNGDFSQSASTAAGTSYAVHIYDPLTIAKSSNGTYTRTEFPNDKIPDGRISPIAKAVLNLIGPANSAAVLKSGTNSQNYILNAYATNRMNSEILRIDQAWNNAHHSFVSLRRNKWEGSQNNFFGHTKYNGVEYDMSQNPNQLRVNQAITLDHSIVLNNNTILDLNYTLLDYYLTNVSPTSGQDATALNFSSNYVNQMQMKAIPQMTGFISGLSNFGTNYANQYENDANHDLKANVVQMWHNHVFRYGPEYMVQQDGIANILTSAGTFGFTTAWTTASPDTTAGTNYGSALASFLLGLPTTGSIPNVTSAMWSQHYLAFYFQDDWRATKKLTFDIGLRWDYERPVTERFNHMVSRFDPDYVLQDITTASQASYAKLISGASSNSGLALLKSQRSDTSNFISKGALLYAGIDGTSPYVRNPRYKYFQPRVGFAYEFRPGLVLRGGVGRFTQADFVGGSQTGYSQTTNFTATSTGYHTVPDFDLANPFAGGLLPIVGNGQGKMTNLGAASSFTDPDIGRQYTDIANMSLQQQIKNILFDLSFTLNVTHGMNMSWPVNNPTPAAWHAAYDPEFTSTGAPVLTQAGDTKVTNPFYHVSGIQSSLTSYTSTLATAYSLLRPNPLLGDLTETRGTGRARYYALQGSIVKRYSNGFSLLQSFTWGKSLTANTFSSYHPEAGIRIEHRLDPNDTKFHLTITPLYQLPVGRGKRFGRHMNRAIDAAIGGWSVNGIYKFQSGTPIALPTNSAFYSGADPSLGSKKTWDKWFNTDAFWPFPTSSTSRTSLASAPEWTHIQALPGYSWVPTPKVSGYSSIANGVYNDFDTRCSYNPSYFGSVRNPYITTFTLGARKSFDLRAGAKFELGFDAFNAMNHNTFAGVVVDPNSAYFGSLGGGPKSKWTQTNNPRAVQLRGRVTF